MADDRGEVIDLVKPKLPKQFSIEEMLEAGPARPEPVPASPEGAWVSSLPRPDGPYEACSRVSAVPLAMLHFLLADQTREGFSYADLRRMRWLPPADPGSGPELVLHFDQVGVRLIGRTLDQLYETIDRNVIGWVRQLPPRWDFQAKGVMVITNIIIGPLEP